MLLMDKISNSDCNINNSITIQEDDWHLPLDFHLFAQYETHKVYLSRDTFFEIQCVESLTPLDMMNLSTGEHDSTGFCVWTGAFLLLVACGDELKSYFCKKNVLELGCGTGISGLGLLLKSDVTLPSFLCLTDADDDALKLCKSNLEQSVPSEFRDQCSVQVLQWGKRLSYEAMPAGLFDTVYAADVLYDISMLPLLATTAHDSLQPGGHFILSHIPRACFNSVNHPPVKNLEDYIVQQTAAFGLNLVRILRPLDLSKEDFPPDALNSMSLQEMEEIGAALLIFQKKY